MKKPFYKISVIRILLSLLVATALLLIPVCNALAATTADVTVTATGAFVSYTSNASAVQFGVVNTSTTTNTSSAFILFTNASSVSSNISVKMLANAWTSAGTGWTHSDTAAGANTAAMKASSANSSTWSTAVFVKYAAAFNEIAQSVAVGGNVITGLSLLAPTSFTDGSSNNNTVRFSFYSATP